MITRSKANPAELVNVVIPVFAERHSATKGSASRSTPTPTQQWPDCSVAA